MIGRELVFSTWYGRCRGKRANSCIQSFLVADINVEKRDANSIWCSQAVTHPSTNQTQRCLTSVIGRELVFSTWYGRCRGKRANSCIQSFLVADINVEKRDANSIWCSQAVTHPSTNQTQHCLTSVIRRELVFSMWYGRCQRRRSTNNVLSNILSELGLG